MGTKNCLCYKPCLPYEGRIHVVNVSSPLISPFPPNISFTSVQIGFSIVTYLFLDYYWVVPFLLPLMFSTQLFLQFVLLLYSDFFCRLVLKFSWRWSRSQPYTDCLFSVCDWVLLFCFFISWCNALIILAPVFNTWHRFLIYPPWHDVHLSSINTSPKSLQHTSAIYFHPTVHLNATSATAAFIPTTAMLPPTQAINLSFGRRMLGDDSAMVSINNALDLQREPALDLLGFENATVRVSSPKSSPLDHYDEHSNYAHRLWPNLYLGMVHNATVGAVLLSDSNWFDRLGEKLWNKEPKHQLNVSFSIHT